MSPTPDPFAPPEAAIGPTAAPEDFFAVFWRWERYRLVYNGLLFGETVFALTTRARPPAPTVLAILAVYAIIANVCFCAGPVVTGYCWRFGYRGRWVALALMIAGTLFAMLLAGIVLISLDATANATFILNWS